MRVNNFEKSLRLTEIIIWNRISIKLLVEDRTYMSFESARNSESKSSVNQENTNE